jgi:Tol biopolymer transport system component
MTPSHPRLNPERWLRPALLLAFVAAGCSSPASSGAGPAPAGATSEAGASLSAVPTTPPSRVYLFDTPFPWSTLPVSGRLLFITYDSQSAAASVPVPYIARLDLATGEVAAVWRPPDNSWLSGMDLSPDRTKLVIAYAPPPPPGLLQSGRPGLYVLPADCLATECLSVAPLPLIEPSEANSYFEPVWSGDGSSIYLSHISTPPDAQFPVYSVERISASGGPSQLLVPNATWPRPFPDGNRLAYVAFDIVNYVNDLYFAAPDGTQAEAPMPLGAYVSVDAPLFSPDGQYIYFSGAGTGPQSSLGPIGPDHRTWLDRLAGVEPAYANGMPSEWWRLPTAGGTPTRLSSIGASGLSGAFSPDGQFFAFVSYSGLGMMAADGGRFTWIYPATTLGNVIWIP